MRNNTRLAILLGLAGLAVQAPFAAWTAIPDIRANPDRSWGPSSARPASRLRCDRHGNAYLAMGDSLYLGMAEGAAWKAASVPRDPTSTTPVAAAGGMILWANKRSFDQGRTWSIDSVRSGVTAMAAFDDGRVLVGGHTDVIRMSEDSAMTWKYSHYGHTYGYIADFVAMPGGWAVAAPSYDYLEFSLNGGADWHYAPENPGIRATMLAVDPDSSADRIWGLDTQYRHAPLIHGIARKDTGFSVSTYAPVQGIPDSIMTAWSVSHAPGGGRRLWIGTWGQGIFASDDDGLTWKTRNEGFMDLHVEALAVTSGGTVLALTRDGLYADAAEATALRSGSPPVPGTRAKIFGTGGTFLFPVGGESGNNPDGSWFRADGRTASPALRIAK